MNESSISARLRLSRENAGMTRQVACEKAGVALSTLEGWERGTRSPKPAKLAELCRTYGVSADYVLGLTEIPKDGILLPGWYLIDQEFVDALLQTNDSGEVDRLCDLRQGAIVDFGAVVRDGCRLVNPEEGLSIERRVVAHIADHGRGYRKRAFRDYQNQHLRKDSDGG